MKRRGKKIFLIVCALIAIFGSVKIIVDRVFCYDSNVAHPRIVEMAVDLYNKNYDPDITKDDLRCLLQGAIDEDTPTRWLNHFYDPVHNRGLKGVYSSAKSWAENSSKQADYALGDKSWQRALDDYKNDDKKKAFTELGHVLHLIADMSVPAHTRNDVHVMPGDSYEQFLKNNWNTATVGVAEKSKVRNISSLSSAFDVLATYSNNNFYSDDTVEDGGFEVLGVDGWDETKASDGKILKLAKRNVAGRMSYVFAIKSSVDWSFSSSYITENKKIVNVDSINLNHTSLLVPEAVGYSAGVIKLFFSEAEKLSAKDPAPHGVQGKLPFFRQNLAGYANLAVGKVVQTAQGLGDAMKARFGGGGNTNSVSAGESPVIESRAEVDSVSSISNSPNSSNSPNKIPNSPPKADPPVALQNNTNTISPYQGETERGSGESTADVTDSASIDSRVDEIQDTNNITQPTAPTAFVVTPPVVVTAPVVYSYGGGGGGGGGGLAGDTTQNTNNITQDVTPTIPETTTPTTETSTTTPTTTPTSTPPVETPTSTPTSTPEIVTPTSTPTSTPEIETPTTTPTSTPEIETPTTTPTSTPEIETPTSTPTSTEPVYAPPDVVINEVAWMGTQSNKTKDEWIELYNNTDEVIDLTGWKLLISGAPITWNNTSSIIAAHDYYLLERTDDGTIINVIANATFIASGGLNNSGENLVLTNSLGETVDEVDCADGWYAGSTASSQYRPMERISTTESSTSTANWQTADSIAPKGRPNGGSTLYGSPGYANAGNWLLQGDISIYYANLVQNNSLTLTKSNSPYYIDYSTFVPAGFTLNIDPGVVLVGVDKSSYINVKGVLNINGTVSESVVFTSALDTNFVQQNLSTLTGLASQAGDWSRIEIEQSGVVNASNAKFLYGGATFTKGTGWVYGTKWISQVLRNTGGTLVLDNVEVKNSFVDSVEANRIYNASVWTESPNGYDSTTTINNATFDTGWTAVNLYGQENGRKLSATIQNSALQNYQNTAGVIVSNRLVPTLTNNTYTNNANDYVDLGIFTLVDDYTLPVNGKYVFTNVTIPIGKILTIEPGVNIKISGDINVNGSLQANGTVDNPINIMPKADYWGIIYFNNSLSSLNSVNLTKGNHTSLLLINKRGMIAAESSNLTLNNVVMMDAERPFQMMYLKNSNTTLKDSVISWTTNYTGMFNIDGIYFSGGTLNLNNTSFNNMSRGIEIYNLGVITVENMTLGHFQNIGDLKWWPASAFTL